MAGAAWQGRFKYGPIEVRVEFAGQGRSPEGEGSHPARIFEVTLKGRGREFTLPDWVPLHQAVTERSLPAMAHAAVMELAHAESDPDAFRSRMEELGWPKEKIEEAVRAASFWGIAIHQAVNPALDEIRRLDERERAERMHRGRGGPREWFPGRRPGVV